MAFVHGKNGVFKIQDSGGVLRDISAFVTKATLKRNVDTPETTTFGAAAKTYIIGVPDGQISVEIDYDPTVVGYLDGIFGFATPRNFEWDPAGTAVTTPKLTGQCILTDYQEIDDIADAGKISCTFQPTGAITVGAN